MMQATRTPVPMAVSSPSGGLHRHEHDGCPTTIVETNHSFEDSRAVGQGMEVRAELDSAVVPDDCLALQDLNYDATISFGLPFEPEDSQYGEYRLNDSCVTLGANQLKPRHKLKPL